MGKVNYRVWDDIYNGIIPRSLTSEEMKKFTKCAKYEEINPIGNLINKNSNWDISGTLIKKLELLAEAHVVRSVS